MQAAGSDRRTLPGGMRILLALGFVLALAATGLVVFADDVKLLRLAAVLALWVALIAAFAIARSMRDTRSAQRRQEEIRLSYEVELHREIAARLEYEVGLNRQLESAHSDQLDSLRGEIDRLASALSRLLDGDVLIERVTLSAESTRVRALSEAGVRGVSGAATAIEASPTVEGDVLVEIDALPVEPDLPPTDDTGPASDSGADHGGVAAGDRDASGEADAEVHDAGVDDVGLDHAPVIDGVDTVEEVPGTVGGVGLSDQASPDHDDSPIEPLPAIQRIDAPATGWTWSHRAASPVDGGPSTGGSPVDGGPGTGGSPVVGWPSAEGVAPHEALAEGEPGEPDQTAEGTPAESAEEASEESGAATAVAVTLGGADDDTDGDAGEQASVPIGELLAAYGLDGGSRRRRRRN